jgi:hypothetical protein
LGSRRHIFVLRLNIGIPGEESVDEAKLAVTRGHVEGGLTTLRWGIGRMAAEE